MSTTPQVVRSELMTSDPQPPSLPPQGGDRIFPTLTPEQIARVAACGRKRAVEGGEVLVKAGQEHYPFFLVVSGRIEIVDGNVNRDGRREDARMSHHPQKLVDARPWDGPGNRSLGQLRHERAGGLMMSGRDDFRIDEDIRIDGPHGSAAVHQIEQLVAIEQVHPHSRLGLPSAKREFDLRSGALRHESLLQQVVRRFLKGATFPRRLFLDSLQKIVIDRKSRSRHA